MKGFIGFALLAIAAFWVSLDTDWGQATLEGLSERAIFETYEQYALALAGLGAGILLSGSVKAAAVLLLLGGGMVTVNMFAGLEGLDSTTLRTMGLFCGGLSIGTFVAAWLTAKKNAPPAAS